MALVGAVDPAQVQQRLEEWLTTRPGFADSRVVNARIPQASGLSNETVMFDVDTTEGLVGMVARVEPSGPALFPHYDLGMQFTVTRALSERTGLPVPRPRWYEPGTDVLGAPFFVMDRLDGQVPPDNPPFTTAGWFMELCPAARAALFDNGLRVLASLHEVNWEGLGLGGLPRGLDHQLDYYENYLRWASDGTPNPTIDAAFEWVRSHRPDRPQRLVLNWGDARVGNMIFDEAHAVVGVLDWEMTCLAGPELDLGWWVFLNRHHTDGMGIPRPDGMPSTEETLARYRELTGYTPSDMHFYEVLAGLRVAVMMVRTARLLIAAGGLPPDSQFALCNPGSVLLAELIGAPAPTAAIENVLVSRAAEPSTTAVAGE